jgi:hypothetical protein
MGCLQWHLEIQWHRVLQPTQKILSPTSQSTSGKTLNPLVSRLLYLSLDHINLGTIWMSMDTQVEDIAVVIIDQAWVNANRRRGSSALLKKDWVLELVAIIKLTIPLSRTSGQIQLHTLRRSKDANTMREIQRREIIKEL